MTSAAFTVSLWLCTTARSEQLPALVTDKDWGGGTIVDVTSHHDFGLTRTSGDRTGWAIALAPDGTWAWNVGDGENRLDYRPPSLSGMIADGTRHMLAFSVDPAAAEARLYRDGVNVATYSLSGLGSLASGTTAKVSELIDGDQVNIEDLQIVPRVIPADQIQQRWQAGGGTVNDEGLSPSPVRRLRVMAWNIWHGGRRDGNEAGLSATIEAIKTAGADVVAMQETYGSGAHIAAGLGYHYYLRSSNLSVMSRYPIRQTHDLYEPFRFGGVTLELSRGQLVRLFSLWIHYLPNYGGRMKDLQEQVTSALLLAEEMETRGQEIEDILTQLAPYLSESEQIPVIVGGDFNSPSHLDWRQDTAFRHRELVVDWPVSLSMKAAGFLDAFREVHPDPVQAPGFTWSPKFSSSWKDRIDYIYLHGSSLSASQAEVYGYETPNWPSDHAAVVVDVDIAGAP